MTIHYLNGTALEAVLLSRESNTLRAAVPCDENVRSFSLFNGAWISEENEPVQFRFAWQGIEGASIPSEIDCICSSELASRLTSMLFVSSQAGDLLKGMLAMYSRSNDSALPN